MSSCFVASAIPREAVMVATVPETTLLEPMVKRIGHELFSSLADQRPHVYQSDWWQGQALEWAMRDEAFKVNLFRFVDVFPTLRGADDIGVHIQEYFDRDGTGDLPAPLRWGLKAASPGHLTTRLVAKAVEYNIHAMAERFIAGKDAEDAVRALEHLRKEHMTFTLDVLGEASLSEEEALEYQRRYLDLLQVLPRRAAGWAPDPLLDSAPWGELPRVNVSLKITSLYSQIDPGDFEGSKRAVLEALRPIFRLGRDNGVFLNLDLEQFRYRDLTYAAFKELMMEQEFRDYPHAGVVVQAYLRDSADDLRGLLEFAQDRETPVTVRLVKGAYWDYETVIARQNHWPIPVFTRKADTDANFELLTRELVANWEYLRPAFGTHNVRSMAHALATAEALGVPQDALEIQMLHGMAEPFKKVIVDRGLRLREYTPVGEVVPGMAYLVRRLLENTANESFLRMTFVERADRDAMLCRPLPSPDLRTDPPVRLEVHATDPADPGTFVNEAHADFSREVNREDMARALEQVRGETGRHIPLYIAGKEVDTGRTIESLNPARPSEILATVSSAGEPEARQALEAALRGFPKWRDTPPARRAAVLFKAADLMRREKFRLSAIEVLEAGKPWREADADVAEAIDFLEYYGRDMMRLAEPRRLDDIPGEIDLLLYEPRGVAVVIAPWNFPLAILAGMTTAALVAGNAVLMKPANPTPIIAYELYRILREAGLPEDVLAFLPGPGGEIGNFLVGHPDVDMIAFTGSKETGLHILKEAAKVKPGQRSVKRVIAEMGGKNAVIIDDDADLDQAVEGTILSAFNFSGQKCSACSRTIVLDEVYDAFVGRLVEAARSLKVGDPAEPATRVGPVINADAFDKIRWYIEKGRSEATLALGAPAPEEGYFVGPHVFVDVTREGIIAQEEIFGPVLSVLRARDFDDALAIALDSQYALTGGLYSRSPHHIRRAYREFRVGNLYINRGITGAMVGRQPFGGFKMSGVGSKAGGPDYLMQFLEPRVITENTLRRGFAPPETMQAEL
jgi:RHH-type transcriptional regulator, proline utilization regulon repressor / proline dehydrogenase / delta 1-pyrroline-5-carboxylate dehydrogenase